MSDHGPDPESSAESIEDGNTEDHPTVTEAISTPHDGPGWLVGDDGGDSAEEWVSQTTHGIRLMLRFINRLFFHRRVRVFLPDFNVVLTVGCKTRRTPLHNFGHSEVVSRSKYTLLNYNQREQPL